MQIGIGFQNDTRSLLETISRNMGRAAELLEESNRLNLEAKRLLLENARKLRKTAGAGMSLHVAEVAEINRSIENLSK